jgi:FKBP-type peptidyl-prolyl cis-trans isomerase
VTTTTRTEPIVRDIKVSGGPALADGDIASILYKVALSEQQLEEGDLIESTHRPDVFVDISIERDQLLEGLYQAILGMKSGGSIRRLMIPAHLAYGDRGWGPVPAGADLWVEVCLSRVHKSETAGERNNGTGER